MPQKNLILFIQPKIEQVVIVVNKSKLIIAVVLAALLLYCSSCKKLAAAAGNQSALESLFEENILNRNFIVNLATDTAVDITSKFSGYNFILTKTNSYYEGPMTATKSSQVFTGTWSCNEDFSKLTINIIQPSVPDGFEFLNRSWKFTRKAFPVMELAPWGTTDPKVLHMQRL